MKIIIVICEMSLKICIFMRKIIFSYLKCFDYYDFHLIGRSTDVEIVMMIKYMEMMPVLSVFEFARTMVQSR
jgi:hypothetical protein